MVRRELDAIVLAGVFLFTRCLESPDGYVLDEELQATELFVAAYPLAPGSVPEPMRELYADLSSSPPGINHVAWHDEAITRLDAAQRTHDRREVDLAIDLLASAVLAARGDANQPYYLSHLGTAWLDRFRITNRLADLDNSVTAHLRALATTVPEEEDQAGHLVNYGATLLARFERAGETRDLDQAVKVDRAAAELARTAHKHHAAQRSGTRDHDRAAAVQLALRTSLSGLSAALLSSFDYRRERADLDEAIRLGQEAIDVVPIGDPARPGLQANLAQALTERLMRSWQVADLKEALAYAQTAVDASREGDPALPSCLLSLANAHAARFAYSGDLRDLDQAISVGRKAVAATPDWHFGQALCLSNLGSALRTRYECVGDRQALDEAITMHQRAVQAAPVGHVSRPRLLNNLGNALRGRFDAAGNAADIEKAVAVLDQAVATSQGGEADRAGYVANLASSLMIAYEQRADPGALARAITILEQEVSTIGDAPYLRHVLLSSLGYVWRAQFDATGSDRALENAITSFRQAADVMPGEHPRRAEYLAGLGSVLRRRFERTTDPATAWDAISACKSATAISTAPASMRALAARDWGQVAAGLGDAAEAMNGFAAAVDLLDRVAWRGLHRPDQERQLGRFVALACDAAAWAIQAGRPERAVELLEQGRGVLLAQSLDARARYHDLDRADPGLAAHLASIDQNLEKLPSADDPIKADDATLAGWRNDLTRQRGTLLQQIRDLPGFADFLRPPAFATLRDAAALGPVVIINVSAYRCDALTVTTSGVRATRLPDLTGAAAVRHVSAFLDALDYRPAGRAQEQTIARTLAWLWDAVVSPLLPDLLTVRYAGQGAASHCLVVPDRPTDIPAAARGRTP